MFFLVEIVKKVEINGFAKFDVLRIGIKCKIGIIIISWGLLISIDVVT